MPKRALVTGAAGFIGKHLVKDLLAHDWDVTGYDLKAAPPDLDCRWIQGSVLDRASLEAAADAAQTVFHLAAHAHLSAPNASLYADVNLGGTQAAFQAAQNAGAETFVATLSAVVWQTADLHGTVTEATPLPARASLAGPYSQSKFDAAQWLAAQKAPGMRVIQLFPTVPVGAGDDAMTAPTQMLEMFLKAPPPAVLDTVFDFVPVQDIAMAHRLAADMAPENQARYILAGERWTMRDVLAALQDRGVENLPRRFVPYAVARAAASVSETLAHWRGQRALSSVEGARLTRFRGAFSATRTRDDLGWRPSSVETAISESLNWLRTRA
ncbi:MAG: NAD-dependent epimerase/dehydratase family protein [Pseudomonadota bacterium]